MLLLPKEAQLLPLGSSVSGQVLDHLGLVVATMEKIQLIQKIDDKLPMSSNSGVKVTMGQRVGAMVLNGLGFIDDRLYMFPEFLENKPVKRFFGPDVEASYFNDDALGRCLDEIYEYGVTKLFSEIAFDIGLTFGLLGKTARFDTTSLIVYGEYDENDDNNELVPENGKVEDADDSEIAPENGKVADEKFQVNHGYSKDGRSDLKQVILNLATTGHANLPIWMAAHSGNASDKVILQQAAERMKVFAAALKEAPAFIFVGDSAIYEKCVEKAGDMIWLSRVTNTINKAKETLGIKEEELSWTALEKGYRITPLQMEYKGVLQRWLLVFSEHMHERESATLKQKIDQESDDFEKKLWHLSNQVFSCQKDAEKAVKALQKHIKYHVMKADIQEVRKHSGKGRPKKDAIPESIGYKVFALFTQNEESIELHRRKLGRFILATNELDREKLSDAEILYEYKQQIHTEAGFRFIKNDAFEVSGVFLKKPSRVQALMMVMTLCLMVYNLAQYFLRQALQAYNDSIPDQLKKPTQKPTMARVCRLFHGVQVWIIELSGHSQEIVVNLTEVLCKIIHYFGNVAEKIYGLLDCNGSKLKKARL